MVNGDKIPVGVLGATGSVGQRFVELLADHPWFELVAVTGSARSLGRRYGEAVRWAQEAELPDAAAALTVAETGPRSETRSGAALPRLLFSALGSDVAGPLESALAGAGHTVVTNASSHRMDPDVPLVVPEVNPEHLELVRAQRSRGGGSGGAILANPNCSTIGLVLALAPLVEAFGVRQASVVTMQAVSGAGLPGVPSMAILDNVVPYIGGEEDKLESEPAKILGRLTAAGDAVEPATIAISAQCNRVPVIDAHLECVSLRLGEGSSDLEASDLEAALAAFRGEPQRLGLPSAPERPVLVASEPDRPQPRLDRGRGAGPNGRGRGMAVTVGRVRRCPLLGWKMAILSHNTLRGAAGGALLLAELAVAKGLVPGVPAPSVAVLAAIGAGR